MAAVRARRLRKPPRCLSLLQRSIFRCIAKPTDQEDQEMRHFLDTIRRWHRRNVTTAQLRNLDDRTLADIGIRRADIPRVISSIE